ncbi:hypothetical protein DMP17_21990 [Pseudonocardia sp. TMWB2A]|uniref:hypothetical protein n=1 Tax=Pseudonocardia sp. TMWB2A TaxID=687430 RepID=UPI00307DA17B
MAEQTTAPLPESLAKYRMAANFAPGQWWHGTFEKEDGTPITIWCEVRLVMHKEQIGTGRKFVHVMGVATDGLGGELVAARGDEFLSLTAKQAKKCGLAVVSTVEAEGGAR